MKRTLFVLAGIAGLLIGMGLIMPAAAKWHQNGPGGHDIMGPLIVGLLIVIAGLAALTKAAIGRRA